MSPIPAGYPARTALHTQAAHSAIARIPQAALRLFLNSFYFFSIKIWIVSSDKFHPSKTQLAPGHKKKQKKRSSAKRLGYPPPEKAVIGALKERNNIRFQHVLTFVHPRHLFLKKNCIRNCPGIICRHGNSKRRRRCGIVNVDGYCSAVKTLSSPYLMTTVSEVIFDTPRPQYGWS